VTGLQGRGDTVSAFYEKDAVTSVVRFVLPRKTNSRHALERLSDAVHRR